MNSTMKDITQKKKSHGTKRSADENGEMAQKKKRVGRVIASMPDCLLENDPVELNESELGGRKTAQNIPVVMGVTSKPEGVTDECENLLAAEKHNELIASMGSSTHIKLPLTGERYVSSCVYRDQAMIHVRQFNDGLPVKGKGLAMTLEQWNELVSCIDEIDKKVCSIRDEEVPNFRKHLGSNKHVSVSTDFYCVDLRQFWLPKGQLEVVPTRKGIALTLNEWAEFKKVVDLVQLFIPEVLTTVPCMLRDDHANQMAFWQCSNCNPDYEQLLLTQQGCYATESV